MKITKEYRFNGETLNLVRESDDNRFYLNSKGDYLVIADNEDTVLVAVAAETYANEATLNLNFDHK